MNAFLLFSHQLTHEQEHDLRSHWPIRTIIPLPADLQQLWSNVPAELDSLAAYLEPIQRWLLGSASLGDLALVQGDFGATCMLVQEAFRMGLVPVYATTKRIVRETCLADGSIRQERVFKHERFRIYGR